MYTFLNLLLLAVQFQLQIQGVLHASRGIEPTVPVDQVPQHERVVVLLVQPAHGGRQDFVDVLLVGAGQRDLRLRVRRAVHVRHREVLPAEYVEARRRFVRPVQSRRPRHAAFTFRGVLADVLDDLLVDGDILVGLVERDLVEEHVQFEDGAPVHDVEDGQGFTQRRVGHLGLGEHLVFKIVGMVNGSLEAQK